MRDFLLFLLVIVTFDPIQREKQILISRAPYTRVISSVKRVVRQIGSQTPTQNAIYILRNMDNVVEILQNIDEINGGKYHFDGIVLGSRTVSDLVKLGDALGKGELQKIVKELVNSAFDIGEVGIKLHYQSVLDKYRAGSITAKTLYKVSRMLSRGKEVKEIAIEITPDVLNILKYASLGSKLDTFLTVGNIIRDLRNILEVAKEYGDVSEEIYQLFSRGYDSVEDVLKVFDDNAKSSIGSKKSVHIEDLLIFFNQPVTIVYKLISSFQ